MIKPLLAFTVAAVFGLGACASSRNHSPGSKVDLLSLRKQLSESEEKIDQLNQRLTLMQIMVDSHQRALQDLADGTTTGDVGDRVEPAPPVAETKTALASGATSSESSPSPPVIDTTPVAGTTPSEVSPAPPVAKTKPPSETEEKLTPSLPNPQYQAAMDIFRNGNFGEAAGLFEAFARQFPKDDLADNALYWSGECRYAQKDFTGALKRFRQVIEDYPSGSKVPDALLKIGFSHLSLGDKESAVTYLKKVVSSYPFSTAGSKAEERLRMIQD